MYLAECGCRGQKWMWDRLEQATVNQYQCEYWELNQGLLQEQQVLLVLNLLSGLLNCDETQKQWQRKNKRTTRRATPIYETL